MLENELFDNWFKPIIITVGYQSSPEEMQNIYKTNIKIKQVIAGQPINSEGSRCNYSCDIENHHLHTYCKACKTNLPYNTVEHECIIGYKLGQIQPDMDPRYLDNQIWWNEPIEVKTQALETQMQVLHRIL